ncbi:hypothetical protein F4780DRAFT_518461 [Xylariomycetidae sp. FL0641]|nr:hypothetical protein F4780DRAFT_518461 [Xylariomycetidae sp. FL0641]
MASHQAQRHDLDMSPACSSGTAGLHALGKLAYNHATDSPSKVGDEKRLVNSPYTEREHCLDLNTLDAENALLSQALVRMECLRPDYATAPYTEIFNWDQIIDEVGKLAQQQGHSWKERSFFIVAFRSQIPPTTVYAELGALDKAAHAEATASGGFLKYWFGTPDKEGSNLATCLWRSQEDAKKGGMGPAHREAASAARSLYSHWKIERYRLIIRDDVQSWDIVDWA